MRLSGSLWIKFPLVQHSILESCLGRGPTVLSSINPPMRHRRVWVWGGSRARPVGLGELTRPREWVFPATHAPRVSATSRRPSGAARHAHAPRPSIQEPHPVSTAAGCPETASAAEISLGASTDGATPAHSSPSPSPVTTTRSGPTDGPGWAAAADADDLQTRRRRERGRERGGGARGLTEHVRLRAPGPQRSWGDRIHTSKRGSASPLGGSVGGTVSQDRCWCLARRQRAPGGLGVGARKKRRGADDRRS